MAKVGIVMGSDSDMPVMAKAADILEQLGISYEMTIISAHREPDVFFEYAKTAEERDLRLLLQVQEWQHIYRVCVRQFSDAGHWYSNAHHFFRRQGFSLFDCTDAKRYSGCNRSH